MEQPGKTVFLNFGHLDGRDQLKWHFLKHDPRKICAEPSLKLNNVRGLKDIQLYIELKHTL